jgi:hypothetical protein
LAAAAAKALAAREEDEDANDHDHDNNDDDEGVNRGNKKNNGDGGGNAAATSSSAAAAKQKSSPFGGVSLAKLAIKVAGSGGGGGGAGGELGAEELRALGRQFKRMRVGRVRNTREYRCLLRRLMGEIKLATASHIINSLKQTHTHITKRVQTNAGR